MKQANFEKGGPHSFLNQMVEYESLANCAARALRRIVLFFFLLKIRK